MSEAVTRVRRVELLEPSERLVEVFSKGPESYEGGLNKFR